MPDRQLEEVMPCAVVGCCARPGLAMFRERHEGKTVAYCPDHRPRTFLNAPAPIVRCLMEVAQK